MLIVITLQPEQFNGKIWEITWKDKVIEIETPKYAILVKQSELVNLAYDFNWDEIKEVNVRPVQNTPYVLDCGSTT